MTLRTTEGKTYEVTADDLTWLLRAVEAEGEPRSVVAKALVGRFLWLLPRSSYRTLADFVQAYSQPVNPRWLPGGDKYRENQGKPSTSPAAVQRRLGARARTTFTEPTIKAVRDALNVIPQRLAVSDFHAASPENRERVKGYLELVKAGDRHTNDLFRARAIPEHWGYGLIGDKQPTLYPGKGPSGSTLGMVAVLLVLWALLQLRES